MAEHYPMLTDAEFEQVRLPINKQKVDNPAFTRFHRSVIKKWIEAHCGLSWTYWDGGVEYAFGDETDLMLFRMWIAGNPLTKEIAIID